MSQLFGLTGTVVMILGTVIIILGLLSTDSHSQHESPLSQHDNQDSPDFDDLQSHIERLEEKIELQGSRIFRIEQRIRGAGIVAWGLICAIVALYALTRNDLIPGICFSAMAISFGFYGLVKVFSNKSSRRV